MEDHFSPIFHCASDITMILVNFEDIGARPSGFCQLIQIDLPTLSSTQAGFNAIRQIIWDNLWQLREIIQFQLLLDKDMIIVLWRSKCTVVTFYCRKFAKFAFFDRGRCFDGLDLGWEVSIVQSCIKRRQAINQLHEKNPLSCKFRTRKSKNFWNATIWFIALSIWKKVTVYQCGQPSSVKPSGVYEKWPQSKLIVSCPVKCNQPNQTVKKLNETCFVVLFRMQTYEGDKSVLHQKVSRYVRIGGQGEQWTHLWPILMHDC